MTHSPGLHQIRRLRVAQLLADDSGSAAAEITLLTPVLVMMLMLVVFFGRLVQTRSEVNDAAYQAARAASLARDPATATSQGQQAATTALAGAGITCENLTVTITTADFRPGGNVIATVSCTTRLGDLGLLNLPAAQTLTGHAASPVDLYREATS